MQSQNDITLSVLRQKLRRAEQCAFKAESDAQYESARQLIIQLQVQISELAGKAA